MGKVNRRLNKRNGSDRPPLKLRSKVGAVIKEKYNASILAIRHLWQRFPRFHRWALIILIPIFIGVLMLPSTNELESLTSAPTIRRDISLNLGNSNIANQVQSSSNGQGTTQASSDDANVIKRSDIVLDSSDIKEDRGMKAKGGIADNGPAPERKPMPSKIYPINGGKVYTINTLTNKPVVIKDAFKSQEQTKSTKPSGIADQWYSLKVPAGETLANIFRAKKLPLGDLYAMANIEGAGKPISRIQAGQTLRYRQNSAGKVTGLQITGHGISASYYRNNNGRFYRQ